MWWWGVAVIHVCAHGCGHQCRMSGDFFHTSLLYCLKTGFLNELETRLAGGCLGLPNPSLPLKCWHVLHSQSWTMNVLPLGHITSYLTWTFSPVLLEPEAMASDLLIGLHNALRLVALANILMSP